MSNQVPSTQEDMLPPHSQEAEEALLGAILVNPEAMMEVAAFLQPDDFYILRNSWMWEAMMRLYERNEPIDNITLAEELRNQGRLEDIDGVAYIISLINNTPTSLHAEVYGRIVERMSLRRRLLQAASEIAQLANAGELNVNEVIERAEASLFTVTEKRLKQDIEHLNEALSEYYDRIEYLRENEDARLGLPTNFHDLDKLLGGFQKSDLIVLAARPGMGKTSFGLNIGRNVAHYGAKVAVFSLEMSKEQLVQRLISSESKIDSQKLRLGELNDLEWERFTEVVGRLSQLPIFLDDTVGITPTQLRTKCRRISRESGLDLVIVDYLQLMNGRQGSRGGQNREQEISYISQALKELAREINVPVLSLAQLNRGVEQRADKRPMLSDLRESGCLTGDTLIALADTGEVVPIRNLVGQAGFGVWAVNEGNMKLERASVSRAFSTGVKPVYRLTTQLGRTIRATANHQFLTICGWKRLDALKVGDRLASPRRMPSSSKIRSKELMNGGICWDAIQGIEFDGEEEVFDLSVPTLHNFVANNMVVHNSIEQNSDVVMFIYRDDVYNEDSETPNQAEIIVAKHRHGPTGVISLFFEKQLTQFHNLARHKVDLGNY